MATSNSSRSSRDRLLLALRRELIGPTEADETIKEFPTTRYVVGRLAPARASESDKDGAIADTENDTLAAGGGSEEDGEEDAQACRRRSNFDHLCRLNFDQGSWAAV